MTNNVVALKAASNTDLNDTTSVTAITSDSDALSKEPAYRAFGRSGNIYAPNPFTLLVDEGFNQRDYNDPEVIETIRRYALRIQEHGLKNAPLICRREKFGPNKGRLTVIDGHLRLRAIYLCRDEFGLELESVDVIIDQKSNDAQQLLMQISTEGLRKTPIQQAMVIQRAINKGMNKQQVAAFLGISVAEVTRRTEVLALPQKLQNLIAADQLSVNLANEWVKEHGETKAVEIAEAKLEERTQAVVAAAQAKASKIVKGGVKAAIKAKGEAQPVDDHPAIKQAPAVVPKVKLTRQSVAEGPKANLKLAQTRANFAEARIVEEDGKKYMMVDLEEWNKLRAALGITEITA